MTNPKKVTKRGPEAADINAGAILRSLRCWRGMSQESLADRLGLTFQQIQKYERGANRMAASTLYKISRILDVSIIEFFAGLDGIVPNTQHLWLSKSEIRLIKNFRGIHDDSAKKHVLSLVENVANCRLDD